VVNTEASTVVAGDRAELVQLIGELEPRGVFCRPIAVSYASHSRQMDPILPAIRDELAGIAPRRAEVPFYSTVVGQRLEGSELDAGYWADNLRRAVRLDQALDALGADAGTVFVELGARPMLAAPVSATGRSLVASQRPDLDAASGLRVAAAELHAHGHPIDWAAMFEGTGARRVELPTYAFQRQRYWLEAAARSAAAGSGPGEPCAWELAGRRIPLPAGGFVHALEVGPGVQDYLADHRAYGRIVVPGAFHASVLLAVAASHWPGEAVEVREVRFVEALVFERASERTTVHVQLTADGEGGFQATLAAWRDGEWISLVTAALGRAAQAADGVDDGPGGVRGDCDAGVVRVQIGRAHV